MEGSPDADADRRAVATANQAFYDAFAERDVARLEGLWAREHDVAVIHPGWPPIFGRDEVLESWRRIIEGPSPPDIRCSEARVTLTGDSAFVVCTEHLPDGDLVATNLFVRESEGWRMVHHQAGPLPVVAPEEPQTMH
jgi:ketosteroid isomerase-like protein